MTKEGSFSYPLCQQIWPPNSPTLALAEGIIMRSMFAHDEEQALSSHFFQGVAEMDEFSIRPHRVVQGPALTLRAICFRTRDPSYCMVCLQCVDVTHHHMDCPHSPWNLIYCTTCGPYIDPTKPHCGCNVPQHQKN